LEVRVLAGIENFFVDINFPVTVVYGTTETAPMITYSDFHDFVPGLVDGG
jgi:long-chain acyl-CoA synthetase